MIQNIIINDEEYSILSAKLFILFDALSIFIVHQKDNQLGIKQI
jgi:hypothetical protein